MSLWIWLSHRFGSERFPGLEEVATQSETLIDLMNKGLEQMCQLNKGTKWRPNKMLHAARKLVRQNAPLLEQQDPLAMAYLDDVGRQKYIYNYEWSDPDDVSEKSIRGSMTDQTQLSYKRLQAA